MAEQTGRQPFRFRLPWLANPVPIPPRAPVESQPPTQPINTIPIQRPSFRPPGLAPPQRFAPPRTESQPPSPSRTAPQSRAASQPSSPIRTATQPQPASQTASQPSSPSRTASQPSSPSRTASQPSSPSKTSSQPATRTSSQPPSPARTSSQVQPTTQTASQPPSPSRQGPQLQPKTQATSQPPSPSRKASQPQPPSQTASQPPSPSRSSASQTEPLSDKTAQTQLALSQPLPQDPQTQVEIPSGTISQPQDQTQIQSTSQLDRVTKQPPQVSGPMAADAPISRAAPEIPALPQPSKSSAAPSYPSHPPKSEMKTEETKEEMPITKPEPKKEEVHMTPAEEEPKQRIITELLTAKKETKGQSGTTSQAEQKQQEKQAVINEKEMAATALEGREGKIAVTAPKDRNAGSESHPTSSVFQRDQASLQKEITEDFSKLAHKLAAEYPKHLMDENPVTVTTLAGENRGAIMHLGSESAKKEGYIHRSYELNQDDTAKVTTDGESSSKGRRLNDPMTTEDKASMAYINSNIQSINNSILHNSSFNERNPGVHLVFSHNPIELVKSNGKTEPVEVHKANFNITPSEKLTYDPAVKRQCLRGIFLESSDSDPDNPEKPQHHGCRYSCEEKKNGKDNE